MYLKFIFLFLIHFCESLKSFEKSKPLSWNENAIFRGFLEPMISTDLSTSIWSLIAKNENGKSYRDIFAEEIEFESDIDASLAKMIIISDFCLHDLMFNQSSVTFKVTKTPFSLATAKNTLICVVDEDMVFGENEEKLSKNDCVMIKDPQDSEIQFKGMTKLLIFQWEKENSECLKRKQSRLYDVLKLKGKEYFHMIHAGDKYLTDEKSLKRVDFLENLKTDYVLVDHQLPEWDEECTETGKELFGILDTNQDEILNQKDVERFVENSEKISVQIDNKVQDFREITFDMRIRVAGAMDFTLPEEDVEDMIVAFTKRDLEMWSQKYSQIKTHDEL